MIINDERLATDKEERDPLNKERIFVSYVMMKRWNQRSISIVI